MNDPSELTIPELVDLLQQADDTTLRSNSPTMTAPENVDSKPDSNADRVGCDALFALAATWDAESKRLFAGAKEKWHSSDNLDLEHQAKVFRRCSSDLQKFIRANNGDSIISDSEYDSLRLFLRQVANRPMARRVKPERYAQRGGCGPNRPSSGTAGSKGDSMTPETTAGPAVDQQRLVRRWSIRNGFGTEMTQLETPDGNDPIAVYACQGDTSTTRLKAAGYTAKEISPNDSSSAMVRSATSIETMSDHAAPTDEQQHLVRPLRISEEMVRIASGNGKYGKLPIDPWHIASNLNAMLEHGYCPKCGLCPNGCEREGCGPNVQADS